jgi:hypothetical protein
MFCALTSLSSFCLRLNFRGGKGSGDPRDVPKRVVVLTMVRGGEKFRFRALSFSCSYHSHPSPFPALCIPVRIRPEGSSGSHLLTLFNDHIEPGSLLIFHLQRPLSLVGWRLQGAASVVFSMLSRSCRDPIQ